MWLTMLSLLLVSSCLVLSLPAFLDYKIGLRSSCIFLYVANSICEVVSKVITFGSYALAWFDFIWGNHWFSVEFSWSSKWWVKILLLCGINKYIECISIAKWLKVVWEYKAYVVLAILHWWPEGWEFKPRLGLWLVLSPECCYEWP